MLTYKHFLVLFAAILLSVQAEDAAVDTTNTNWDKNEQESTAAGNPTDEAILGQSAWANFANRFGSEAFPTGSLVDPMGLFFPTLFTFSALSGRNWNPNFFDPTILASTNTDALPAASNVLRLLADDKRSRNVKRSPIFPQELLRQARQSPDLSTMLSQFVGQFNQGMNTMLGQAQDDSASQDSFLGQARNALGPLSQWLQNATGQIVDMPDSTDDSSRSLLGQALNNNPFNLDNFMSALNQMIGAESQISEVRVRPDTAAQTEEQLTAKKIQEMRLNMLLLQALSDKKLPILWFRDVKQKPDSAADKKTAEEILLEQKLFAFERQVIKELRLLQEIERQAREMQKASHTMPTKVSKGGDYKLKYVLNEKPVHKITLEDIEKALADEYVLKMLQKKTQMQDAGKHIKRNSYPSFNKEEAAEILAYALRKAANEETSRKENIAANMDMRNQADIQSIDEMQKNWMQSQYQAERMQNPTQESAYYYQQNPQNPEFVGTQQTEQALENEDMNEFERKKGFKGFGFRDDDFDSPIYHYHYYLPARNDYNSRPSYSSSYSSGPSYSQPSYSSGPSYSHQPSYSSGQSYSSSGYRTATGDEEIEQIMQSDPAWSELKSTTTPQQQQQQQQTMTHERKTRLASNVKYWLVLGKENKNNRQKRQAGMPALQAIDESALEELRATYGKALKEITLQPHEDPTEALMRYNSAAYQQLMVDEQNEPVEMDSDKQRFVAARAQPMFVPQLSNAGSFTAIDASALFDSRNITESLLNSVLEEVNRRLTSCCTKCKDSIIADIKEKLERNEKNEETEKKEEQYFEDWLKYMSSKGYDKQRLTKIQYADFLRYNNLSHFDIKHTNNIKRETNYIKVKTEGTDGTDVAKDLKQADEIVTNTMKPRKRLRLRKNRKNTTTTNMPITTTTPMPMTTTPAMEVTTLPPTV